MLLQWVYNLDFIALFCIPSCASQGTSLRVPKNSKRGLISLCKMKPNVVESLIFVFQSVPRQLKGLWEVLTTFERLVYIPFERTCCSNS